MKDPRKTHTLSEFISAGKSSNGIMYSTLSFIENRNSIDFPIHNILNDHLYEFKKSILTINLSDSEYHKYKYKPKLLANDIYNNPELYFVILALNNICNVKEFDMKAVRLLRVDDMNTYLSQIYNVEKKNIAIYNNK